MVKHKINWTSLITVGITIIIIAYFGISDPNVKDLGSLLAKLDPLALLAALGCFLIYLGSESEILYLGCKLVPGDMSFGQSVKSSIIGNYYSALTPFSSGGQPFQVAYMRRWNVPAGSSSSILTLIFFLWHIWVSMFSIVAFMFYRPLISAQRGLTTACIVGIILSLFGVIVGGLLMSGISLKKPLNAIIRFLNKIRIIKNPGKIEKVVTDWVEDFNKAVVLFKKYPKNTIGMLFLSLVKLLAYCSVVYCIYRGFGLSVAAFVNIILLQVLLTSSVAFVPLPGASGASEGVFYVLFGKIFVNGTTFPAMLLWRVFTYYIYLFLGAILSIYDGMRGVKADRKKIPQ